MNAFIAGIVIQMIAMMLTALLLPGLRITSFFGALGAVLALSVLNSTIWDASLFFQLPTSLGQQTLILLVANGVLFWIVMKLLPGIEISGIFSALLAPILFTALTVVVHHFTRDVDWVEVGKRAVGEVENLRDTLREKRPAGQGEEASPAPSAAPRL